MSDNSIDTIKKLFTQYIVENHQSDLVSILEASDLLATYVIQIESISHLTELVGHNNRLLFNGFFYLELLKASLVEAQKYLIEVFKDTGRKLKPKKKIYPRIVSVSETEYFDLRFPDCTHLNKLICFNGTVTKVFKPILLEFTQTYECNKCGLEFKSDIDYGSQDLFVKPSCCPKDDCDSDKFKCIELNENFRTKARDYQEIKVQEKLDFFSSGTVPKSLLVILEDDLVDACKPGDDVSINGIVIQRWNRLQDNLRCDNVLILHANYVKVKNDDQTHINITKESEILFYEFWREHLRRPLTGRNIILSSVCPQLYGMYLVKLAVSLAIIGGVSRKDDNGTTIRGESHLLLVGDPGTGKSQFLKYANKLVPRSILTTGIGSTSAGLTATASKEGGSWHLEAGALVLADGGICCVDEFNCMKEADRCSMLEAMEQQSLSIAKAGMVCKLKTQCSVLAACNPKGSYDPEQPMTVNIAIASPLLSRFDVVLLMLDSPNEDWDHIVSLYLLQGKDLLKRSNQERKLWDFEQLRLYFNYVKSLQPRLTPDANLVIQNYYQFQRKADNRNAARTTVRMLESVIRLSQAHAKLMLRDTVLPMDAIVAITLLECSANKTSLYADVNILHTSFPSDGELEYRKQAELILGTLGLGDLLAREIDFIETNFEPFQFDGRNSSGSAAETANNTPTAAVAANAATADDRSDRLDGTQCKFDVMSQLISAIPTQSFRASHHQAAARRPQRTASMPTQMQPPPPPPPPPLWSVATGDEQSQQQQQSHTLLEISHHTGATKRKSNASSSVAVVTVIDDDEDEAHNHSSKENRSPASSHSSSGERKKARLNGYNDDDDNNNGATNIAVAKEGSFAESVQSRLKQFMYTAPDLPTTKTPATSKTAAAAAGASAMNRADDENGSQLKRTQPLIPLSTQAQPNSQLQSSQAAAARLLAATQNSDALKKLSQSMRKNTLALDQNDLELDI